MRDQLVNETIDTRILRLIGLEDVFDLDYETYLVLLREAQVKGKNTIPAEEQALLANERKRIRGKVGRFKVKSKTIKVENITSVKGIGQKLLPSSRGVGPAPIIKSLTAISKTVESISENLSDQSKDDKKEAEENRKEEENRRRSKREESLESSAKKVIASAKKLFTPVKGIFDAILNWIFYTFLGKGITTALEWFANPANKEKVNALGKFVKDWWPTLLVSAGLFLTPLRGFIGTTLGLIRNLAFRFPLVAAAAGASIAGEIGDKKLREMTGSGYSTAMIGSTPTPFGAPKVKTKSKTEKEIKENQEAPYGRNPDGTPKLFPSLFASGGLIDSSTGIKISGAGPDTQLTALQPGEIVMNRSTVQAVGAHNLLALNKAFGGPNANKPRFAGNIRLMRGGGLSFGGVQAGFTGMAKEGFEAIMGGDKFRLGRRKPQILGRGAYSAPTMRGAQRYAGAQGSLGGRQTPGGVVKSIVPGGAPRINFLEPQAKVKPAMFDKGKLLADKLLRGEYANSRLANRLRAQLTSGVASPVGAKPGGGFGAVSAGIELGALLAPLAVEFAKQRRAAQQKRYSSLMLGKTDVSGKTASIVPTPRPRSSIINLPPAIVSGGTPGSMVRSAGTEIPSFSAIAPANRRSDNAAIYGLMG